MRENMKTILSGIRAINFKGKLTPFGFTTDEIAEVIEEDMAFVRVAEEEEKKLPKTTAEEREMMLIKDEVISEENAWEKKRTYLKDEYEKVAKEYFEAKHAGGLTKEHEAQKNRKKFDYEVRTYRTEYDKKHYTEEEIIRADGVELDRFIKVDSRGFCCCPFHHEKKPSMHITKNMFYCFGCGEKGKAIKFIMKTQGLNFQDAIKSLL